MTEHNVEEAQRLRVLEAWGPGSTGSRTRMAKLGCMFPTLRGVDGVDPWDAEALVWWLFTSGAPTTGSRHAAKFLLTVWNYREDWGAYAKGLGIKRVKWIPFNAIDAMGSWDDLHQNAFRAWVNAPFWP